MLGLETRDKVIVQVDDGQVVVKSAKDVLDMAGTVKPVPGVSDLKMREEMESNYQRE